MSRVMIVGQSYVLGEARKKLTYLAAQPDVSIALVTPTVWEHGAFGRYEFQPAEADRALQLYAIPIRNNGRAFAFSYQLRALWRAVRQFKPDILQVEQEPGSLALFQCLVLARLAQRTRLVAFTWENLYYRQPGIRHYFERLELAQLDYLLVGNTAGRDVFQRKGYRGPIAVVPNVGVDADHYLPRPVDALRDSLGLSQKFVVGFAGRLVPEKGCDTLIAALADLPADCHVLLVGGGEQRDSLSQQACELGLADRVTFQPTVPHSEVATYLNAMDCLVLPSRTVPNGWREQFGLVLAQAMACGVPVIGSDSGAIPEVIADAGLIFPEGDAAALRERLVRLHNDPALRAELSAKGRARVLAYYTHQRIAEQTAAIYRELLGPS
ncbi:MAG: glycosyltransferase family 4 protein [Chloroflexi bacterium]|nr:glycosyltransferase family 4 protein [Chloroflexota bacterium]